MWDAERCLLLLLLLVPRTNTASKLLLLLVLFLLLTPRWYTYTPKVRSVSHAMRLAVVAGAVQSELKAAAVGRANTGR